MSTNQFNAEKCIHLMQTQDPIKVATARLMLSLHVREIIKESTNLRWQPIEHEYKEPSSYHNEDPKHWWEAEYNS